MTLHYIALLRSKKEDFYRTISARNITHAKSLALEIAARLSKETGDEWRVARVDPA